MPFVEIARRDEAEHLGYPLNMCVDRDGDHLHATDLGTSRIGEHAHPHRADLRAGQQRKSSSARRMCNTEGLQH